MPLIFLLLVSLLCGCQSLQQAPQQGLRSTQCPQGLSGEVLQNKDVYVLACRQVLASGESQLQGPYYEWYAEGSPKVRGQYQGGKKEGVWEGWFKNAQQEYSVQYQQGLRHGEVKMWFENSQPNFISHWQAGRLHGEARQFDVHGKLQSIIHYENGKIHGLVQHFDEQNGQKVYEAQFVANNVVGIFREWHSNGVLALEAQMDAQHRLDGPYQTWWPNGQKRSQAQYEQGQMKGPKLKWREDGTAQK